MAKYVVFSHLNPHLDKALRGQTFQEYIGNLESVSYGIVDLLHVLKPLKSFYSTSVSAGSLTVQPSPVICTKRPEMSFSAKHTL